MIAPPSHMIGSSHMISAASHVITHLSYDRPPYHTIALSCDRVAYHVRSRSGDRAGSRMIGLHLVIGGLSRDRALSRDRSSLA